MKPQLLIVEYNLTDQELIPPPSDPISMILEYILNQNPNQQIIFVTAEERLMFDPHFLPPSLQHIPIILKSTHTVDDMVMDLEELPFYYPPL